MAYDLWKREVKVPGVRRRFHEGVTYGKPSVRVVGGKLTPDVERAAQRMYEGSLDRDWVKGSKSTSEGLAWLMGGN